MNWKVFAVTLLKIQSRDFFKNDVTIYVSGRTLVAVVDGIYIEMRCHERG
jgi:hypothetical protein